ncbi:MAG: SdrD B-like domain-containing protein [Anaerolineae bacterium]
MSNTPTPNPSPAERERGEGLTPNPDLAEQKRGESPRALRASPYKGLMPYDKEDAQFFFGRERDTEIITANLLASRLTLLYGASGVGKSSVLRAGVEHALFAQVQASRAEQRMPEFIPVLFGSWRDDPVSALLMRVSEAIHAIFKDEPVELPAASGSLAESLHAWSESIGVDLLIILDQFEEYFLYHPQEEREGTFAVEFPRAVNRRDLRVNFLVCFREDALARLDRFKGRIPGLYDNYLRIKHLDRAAARTAIQGPIDRFNELHALEGQAISLEPELTEAVLDKVRLGQVVLGESGRGAVDPGKSEVEIETPYLQLVMTRIWDEEMRAGSRLLRLETLQRMGGAEQIVRAHLDDAMGRLPAAQQEIAASAFDHLVTPSGTKIAHTVRDLARYAGVPEPELSAVLEQLASGDSRILRPIAPPPDQPDSPRYEIFHDVLGSAILDWEARHEKERERQEAEERLARERAEADKQLAQQRAEAERQLALTQAAAEKERADAAQALVENQSKALSREQTLTRRLVLALAGVMVLLVVALTATYLAYDAGQKSDLSQKVATSREYAAQAVGQLTVDPEKSLLLSLEALKVYDSAEAENALRQALLASHVRQVLRGHTAGVTVARYSPDGKLILSASGDGTAQVWDTTGKPIVSLKGHSSLIWDAAFSPNGKWIVTASLDKTARVWEAATGKLITTLTGHTGFVWGATFSPDGVQVVTASDDHTARVWNAQTGQVLWVLRGHTDRVTSASFSPDGRMILTSGNDGAIMLWDAATGVLLGEPLSINKLPIVQAAFSPDGRTIAAISSDSTATLWNVATHQPVGPPLSGHTASLTDMAFSADGRFLATAGQDKTARVWDMATQQTVAELLGHTATIRSVSFSPDGNWIVTAAEDDTVRVWETSTGRQVSILRGHTGVVNSAEFSPDGKRIVTASTDGTARIWDPGTGAARVQLRGHEGPVSGAVYSWNDKIIASGGADGNVILWDAETDQALKKLPLNHGKVMSIAATYDQSTVAAGMEDGSIVLINAETRQVIGQPLKGHVGAVRSLAMSSDGKRLASGGEDKTVRFWDLERGVELETLAGHTGTVNAVLLDMDAKKIVSASADGTTRVWDFATGKQLTVLVETQGIDSVTSDSGIYSVFTGGEDAVLREWQFTGTPFIRGVGRGHSGPILDLLYAYPVLLSASADKTARVWELTSGQPLLELRGHSDQVVSVALDKNERSVLTASLDGTLLIFDCDICGGLSELQALARERVTRELDCQERSLYLHETAACTTPTPATPVQPTSQSAAPTAPPSLPSPTACVRSVAGTVFNDANGNGQFDKGETALSGVQVSLYDSSGGKPLAVTATDAQGVYRFSTLPTGSYSIQVMVPQNYRSTTASELKVELSRCGQQSLQDVGVGLLPTPTPVPPSTATPTAPPNDGALYYGHWSGGIDWSERYFDNTSRGQLEVPQIGDVIVATGNVYINQDYTQYTQDKGWVYAPRIGIALSGDRFRVVQVNSILGSYIYCRVIRLQAQPAATPQVTSAP